MKQVAATIRHLTAQTMSMRAQLTLVLTITTPRTRARAQARVVGKKMIRKFIINSRVVFTLHVQEGLMHTNFQFLRLSILIPYLSKIHLMN
jgi:hypothetical protein